MADVGPEVLPEKGPWSRVAAIAGIVVGGLYLLNPGAGIIELIPDNLPFVGNLDEAAAAGLLILGLQRLGADIRRRRGGDAGSAPQVDR